MEQVSSLSFIKDKKKAVYGSINGIVLDSLMWPYLAVILLQFIFGDFYSHIVEKNMIAMQLFLRILTMAITFVVAVFIAKPQTLLKAYSKFDKSKIKWIFIALGTMIGFSVTYNMFLLISGVDISNGNANQNAILEMISEVPLIAFISTVIFAPIVEEITYRYFLYGGIATINKKWAIVISGFIFMSLHAVMSFTSGVDNIFREILLLPPYMFSGMALAFVYEKSENLGYATATHALNNLISFILCFL